MFQDQLEKGLFTFYWEETHTDRKDMHHSHRSQLVEPEQLLPEKDVPCMEEKKTREKHHKTQKQETGIKRHQSYLYFQIEKQNKNVLIPHTITLAPGVACTKPKVDRDQYKIRHFKQTAKLKTLDGDKRQEEANQNAVEKLLFSDEAIECHKKTIEIDESQSPVKISCLSTVRPAKIRKMTLKDVQNHEKLQSFQKFPTINIHNDPPSQSSRLPLLFASKSSHKKLKKLKENYLLQKICLKKDEQEVNSVVNLGMSSIDDYKLRWRKRKAEFLALLSQSVEDRRVSDVIS